MRPSPYIYERGQRGVSARWVIQCICALLCVGYIRRMLMQLSAVGEQLGSAQEAPVRTQELQAPNAPPSYVDLCADFRIETRSRSPRHNEGRASADGSFAQRRPINEITPRRGVSLKTTPLAAAVNPRLVSASGCVSAQTVCALVRTLVSMAMSAAWQEDSLLSTRSKLLG